MELQHLFSTKPIDDILGAVRVLRVIIHVIGRKMYENDGDWPLDYQCVSADYLIEYE